MPDNTSAAVPGRPTPSAASRPRARWLVFAVVIAADLLDMIDSTVTTIASPTIVRDLDAPDGLVSWLALGYPLALGSLLVVGGRLGDRIGQRRTFLIGVLGFTAASLLCGLAWGPMALVAFRLVQGAFGALLIPQGFALLLAAFPREGLGRVFGLFGPLLAIGSISGPVLAGLLVQVDLAGLGWRAIFLVNGVIGTALLVAAPRILPRGATDPSVRIDPLGSSVLMLGLLGILGALVSGADRGWDAPPVTALALGTVLVAWFVILQRRSRNPLLAPGLFRVRSFVTGITVATVFFAAVTGLMYVVSLWLQRDAHLTTFRTALVMAPTSVGIIATSFGLRAHVQRLGRRLVQVGVLTTLLGTVGLLVAVQVDPDHLWVLSASLLVAGLGMGSCFGSLFATALGDVDEAAAGSASGTLNALQQVGNAAGAALISTLFVGLSARHDAATGAIASLGLIAGVLVLTALLSPLLPRRAAADQH